MRVDWKAEKKTEKNSLYTYKKRNKLNGSIEGGKREEGWGEAEKEKRGERNERREGFSEDLEICA